uniref:Uncharacterized protein n=1 Tax=Anguilla anguilla TaxID=7936 RepID=A0A0E9RIZ2_ANGAN
MKLGTDPVNGVSNGGGKAVVNSPLHASAVIKPDLDGITALMECAGAIDGKAKHVIRVLTFLLSEGERTKRSILC